jgi:predicted nucleotidyltransferase
VFEGLIARTASALERHGVPYMVIGGQAVLLYGSPRLTKDIDITVGVGVDGLALVLNAAREAGLEVIPEDHEDFVNRTFVLPVRDVETGIRVDVIFSYTPYESQAIERAKNVELSGTSVKFASLEDLVIHKVFSGRPRDIEDVKAILIKNADRDDAYIRKWLAEFDRASGDRRFSGLFEDVLRQAG